MEMWARQLVGAGLVAGMVACASLPQVSKPREGDALAVVEGRIRAFNRHDLAAYLGVHHEDVDLFRYPDRRLGVGRDHLEKIFGPTMEAKDGRIEIQGQFVVGNVVISHEVLTMGARAERYVALYTVEGDQIRTIRLIEDR